MSRKPHPRVFVRVSEEELRESGFWKEPKRLLVREDHGFRELVASSPTDLPPSATVYAQINYDDYRRIIDLESSTVVADVVFKTPRGLFAMEKGSKLVLIELKGRDVRVFKEVGEEVREGEKIAQTLSRKFVVRTIRSPIAGTLLYVTQMLDREGAYLLAIAPKG